MSNSLLVKFKLFAPQIWQLTVRHRGKFNVKMPLPRHDIARYLEEITRPVIVKELPDPIERCIESKEKLAQKLKFSTKNAIDFEKFLANHALKLIKENEVMLIFHKLDCPGETFRRNKIEFKKLDTQIWNFNTTVMKLLIENNPKYQNLYPIVDNGLGRNYYFFLSDKNLKKLLQVLRRMPHLMLLGGLIQETLMTRASVQNYIQMDDIETLRGQLCNVLNHQMSQLCSTLSNPQLNFCIALDQYSKQAN